MTILVDPALTDPETVLGALDFAGVAVFAYISALVEGLQSNTILFTLCLVCLFLFQRRKRDSNPRYRCQYDSLANCSFRPLRHLSNSQFIA